MMLAQCLRATGQHERAAAIYQESLRNLQRMGDLPIPLLSDVYRVVEAIQWIDLGDVMADLARTRDAEGHYKKTLAIYAGLDPNIRQNNTVEGLALSRLGDLYTRAGRAKEAEEA